jgi:threonine 3-dehydrogenase
MPALVTGGAGFIGAQVVRILLENGGDRPTVFSRNPSPSRLAGIAGDVNVVSGDVGDFSHVLNAVSMVKPDVIYHFGAMLSVPSDADPSAAIQTNAIGTFHVLEAARIFGVRQVIFASSVGVFGTGIEGGVRDDFTLQRPVLVYGATKVFGEHLGLFYKRKYGMDFRGLRYPSIIGPGVSTPGVSQYTSQVMEQSAKGNPYTMKVEPELRTPVMYITEAGQAAVQLAAAPVDDVKTIVYNIDGIQPTPTAKDLVDAVKRHVPSARIDFDIDRTRLSSRGLEFERLDDSRARAEWGWNPTYDLDSMVSELIAELERHPERYP